MRLQVGGRLDHVSRPDHPAHAPARHGVRLGDPVDHDAAVGELGDGHGHGTELRVAVDQVFVDLVGDDPDPPFHRPLADRLDLGRGVDRAAGVGRGHEDQRLGLVGDELVELSHAGAVAGGLVGRDLDHDAPAQVHHLGVRGPERCGQQYFVTAVQQGRERVVQRLFAPVADEHLVGGDRQAGVPGGLGSDGLAQRGLTGGRGVPVALGVAGGDDGGLDDVVGGGEVRLACAETDDRATLRLHRLGLGVDGQGGRLRDSADTLRDPGGDNHAVILSGDPIEVPCRRPFPPP